jgi:ADP-ribosylglycohydrolase
MNTNADAMLLASLAGDSLALGVHWIYNTNVIDRKVGRIEGLLAPIVDSWHPNRTKGQFTHYGDQTLVLLQAIAEKTVFDIDTFARHWQALFRDYNGYMDSATKATLENFSQDAAPSAAGSASSDLGGAARIAPLVYLYRHDEEALLQSARQQTAMTHNQEQVIDSAAFFAWVTHAVLNNATRPVAAIESVTGSEFNREPFSQWVEQGLASAATDSRTAIKDFGQMCEVEAAFPATIHLIARYEDNLSEALIENCMAGGDSASRGLVAGMVLGAGNGWEQIPPQWLADMAAYDAVKALIAKL